ncbi:MAG: hypothetical protein ABFR97_02835 [Thermodesulfobacteriota bacterium]
MQKRTLSTLAIFVLGYGAGLITMLLSQPHPPTGPELSPRANSSSQASGLKSTAPTETATAQPAGRQQRNRASSWTQQQRPNANQESMFWQAMTLVQHGIDSDSLSQGGVAAALDRLNDEELTDIITTYTKLAPHDYPPGVDTRDFAQRLGEIYYQNPAVPDDSELDLSPVEFGKSVKVDNKLRDQQECFSQGTNRIYASFATGEDYASNSVMVKWSRLDSPEVLIYDKYAINRGTTENYVWLEIPNGWEPGVYKVQIFSLENNLNPLFTGSYTVGGC